MTSETRQRIGHLGCGLVLGLSLLLFLLPGNYTPSGLTPDAWLAVMMALLLLFWLGLLLGLGLLMLRYLPFFQQIKGPLLFFGLFVMGLRAFTFLQSFSELGWPASQFFLLLAAWLLALIGALLLALCVYLWYQDRAIRLVAVTFLAAVWLLIAYTRWHGPEQTLQDVFLGVLPAELFGLLCFAQFVFVLAPFFFAWHTVRLAYREWTRADMLLVTDDHGESMVEKIT
jgi:hypothetical protein